MQRIAVVLGAGGITGIAWLLGALEAIRGTTGWDAADADVLCGTSAGAVAAAVTAARMPSEPLVRMAEDPTELDRAVARATAGAAVGHRVPLAWPGSLALGLTGLASVNPQHRLRSLAGFVPSGYRSGDEIRGLVFDAAAQGWPARQKLLVNVTDYRTARRVTFGLDGAPEAPLVDAVTASAAVPGYYRPVAIADGRYIDGGVVSFSNVDVVAQFEPDLVLCLSPFATTVAGSRADAALLGPLRRATAKQLQREVTQLRASGARVEVIEPTRADLDVMGLKLMERSHARAVLECARTSVTTRLQEHPLEGLGPAPARAARLVA
jgi:NTE family protein